MKRIRVILACAAAGVLLSACTQGATGPPSTSSVDPIASSKLQLSVGTINVAGAASGLNVVSTLRQPNGDSAVLVNTPTLTGPFTLPAASTFGSGNDSYDTINGCSGCAPPAAPGPSMQEVAAGGTLSGTPSLLHLGTPACDSVNAVPAPFTQCTSGVSPNSTTFGQSGGVFGMGFGPYNHTNSGVAYSYVPYFQPTFDTTGSGFEPWGGPPDFDPNKDHMGTRDGLFNLGAGLLGVAQGITMFENVTPGAGTYTLSVSIPTSPTSFGTVSTTATLTSLALLPTLAAPSFVSDTLGGGTVTVAALPAPITEAYIEVIDFGGAPAACQGPIGGSAFPVYYTIHITAPGAYALPDKNGPNNGGTLMTPTQSLCTGDSFSIFVIGVDYPLFAASYPNSLGNQAPTIVGAGGQSDITISGTFSGTYARVHGHIRNDHRSLRTMNKLHPTTIRHR